MAGILGSISGFVFGKCSDCGPGKGYGSLTLEEVLDDHIKPLGIPAWYGSMIGHIENKFTIPLGIEAEIDAGVECESLPVGQILKVSALPAHGGFDDVISRDEEDIPRAGYSTLSFTYYFDFKLIPF